MKIPYSVTAGKTVQKIARLRGGGSALPGLVIEKIDPRFVERALLSLPQGVVVISGTNGKTTTTKMVVALLESQGLKVFTNKTGSNFVRGVAAALLGEVDRKGKLDADIAVLELDEAHAVHFVRVVQPDYSLLLNVMRDQLDRFGEIDTTAQLLYEIGRSTTKSVVINRDDPRLSEPEFIASLTSEVSTYGVSESLRHLFPSDDTMHSNNSIDKANSKSAADTTLLDIENETTAIIDCDGTVRNVDLKLRGSYNIQNAVGAVALTRAIMGDELDKSAMFEALSSVKPAFGRGETITIDGQPVELVLIKNPSGFRLSLSSFSPNGYATMVAINDTYADGRDMSWLWDVDFDSLSDHGVCMVSGVRAYDMALRLQYDEVPVQNVNSATREALHAFIDDNPSKPKRIFCSYTAMLALRRELSKIGDVEAIL